MTNPAEQPASGEALPVVAWLTPACEVSNPLAYSAWETTPDDVLRNNAKPLCLLSDAAARIAALEAETSAMSATEACATIPAIAEYVAQLEAECDALRKDAERLDYLQQQGATVSLIPSASKEAPDWYFRIGGRYCSDHADIRAAIDIDAALSKKGPQA
jgi:hypothetical protein